MSFTSFLNDRQTPGAAQPQTANQLFGSATFQSQQPASGPAGGSSEFAADAPAAVPTASDLFNASAYDPAKLHPLADLGSNLDYLLLDEAKLQELPGGQSALPSRGWSDELSYGTGTTYLSGKSKPRLEQTCLTAEVH
jgi:import inner membrane translocase subunit TIM23